MKTLDEIHGDCRVDDITGCWHWAGAFSGTLPRIYAPDWAATRDRFEAALSAAFESGWESAKIKAAIVQVLDPVMTSQPGRRAVWNIATGKPIPNGWRVYGTCMDDACVSLDHMRCGSAVELGRFTVKTGRFRNQPNRIAANRITNLKRSSLTTELVDQILLSEETGVEIAARTGLGRTVISKVRTGAQVVHRAAGGLFAGLGARNA